MTALTIMILCALACIAIPIALVVLSWTLEVLPLAVGLLVCWWLFHAVGCL